jgi:hypothetical protein
LNFERAPLKLQTVVTSRKGERERKGRKMGTVQVHNLSKINPAGVRFFWAGFWADQKNIRHLTAQWAD